jgi:isoleucyl-tRNA synthetase
LAREIVHVIQQMRRNAGYQVEDRIVVIYEAEPHLAAAIDQHTAYIQKETLARSLQRGQPIGDRVETLDIDGAALTLGVRRDGV